MAKVSIVGAGFVGSTTAYALLLQGVAREIVLIDVNGEKAKGEAMDLEHGLQFLPAASVSYSDDIAACKGSDIVIVCAGANQKPGETRLDLAKKNAGVFRQVIPEVARAAPKCVMLIVTNPVDVLTRLALKLSKFPPSRVIGSGTTLDTARLRYLMGRHYGLHPSSIHAYVLGEHGDTSFPAWSCAAIGGIELRKYPGYDRKALDAAYEQTRKAAYEIISRKGATYYAIGIAVSMLCQSILKDENKVYAVSTQVPGLNGVCLSMPCALGSGGISRQILPPLDAAEKAALKRCAATLQAAYHSATK